MGHPGELAGAHHADHRQPGPPVHVPQRSWPVVGTGQVQSAVMGTSSRRLETLRDYLRSSWRVLLKEVAAFGMVGAMALVIDLGIFAAIAPHGALKAKIVSSFVSTLFAYFGNRHWSFSHRARTGIARESSFFFLINAIVLVGSLLVLALFVYPLHFPHGSRVVFAVNVGTIGLGTLFRFWAYKRFVFLHPDRVRSRATEVDRELAA
jgi:putative flippase GtrA